MSSRRRRSHEDHEEHENHERWLVSYADMITVLMALFIVLFAISTVDATKFEALKASLASSFGNPIAVVNGGKSPTPGDTDSEWPMNLSSSVLSISKPELKDEVAKVVREARARDALAEADRTRAAVRRELADLERTRAALTQALRKRGLQGSVRFRYDERGLVVSIVTDQVLFAADRATLSTVGAGVLAAMAPVLRDIPNDLLVEGHTNTVPVAPKYFPSEWELSATRATTVVRFLIDRGGLAARRLSAAGYADQRPLIEGTSPRANRLNRRVEVVVASTLPPQDRALLPTIAATDAAPNRTAG